MRQTRSIATGVASLLVGLAALAAIAFTASGGGKPATVPPGSPNDNQVDITLSGMTGLGLQNAVIGDRTDGAMTVTNAGNTSSDVVLSGSTSAQSASITTLAQQLRLVIYKNHDNTGNPVFEGTVAAFNSSAPIPLGMLGKPKGNGKGNGAPQAPASMTLYFHVTLLGYTSGQDNALQNLGLTETFHVRADRHAGQ